MPRRPDVPCSSCGRLIWRSATSLPPGEATCQPCRRKGRVHVEPRIHGDAECPICSMIFAKSRANQVYCSASCRESRRNWSYATKAASTEERGYGKAHREERARWKPIVDAGQAYCCLCGYWIEPGSKWHLDHDEDRTGYRGVAHASCNTRDGARRGARRVNASRPQIQKQCATCHRGFTTVYPKQTYCTPECRPRRPRQLGPRPKRQKPHVRVTTKRSLIYYYICQHCQTLKVAKKRGRQRTHCPEPACQAARLRLNTRRFTSGSRMRRAA